MILTMAKDWKEWSAAVRYLNNESLALAVTGPWFLLATALTTSLHKINNPLEHIIFKGWRPWGWFWCLCGRALAATDRCPAIESCMVVNSTVLSGPFPFHISTNCLDCIYWIRIYHCQSLVLYNYIWRLICTPCCTICLWLSTRYHCTKELASS